MDNLGGVIWDLIGAAGFVVALAAIMGVFSRQPRTWGYPPVDKPGSSLLGVVLPPPRESTEDVAVEQMMD